MVKLVNLLLLEEQVFQGKNLETTRLAEETVGHEQGGDLQLVDDSICRQLHHSLDEPFIHLLDVNHGPQQAAVLLLQIPDLQKAVDVVVQFHQTTTEQLVLTVQVFIVRGIELV